MTFAARVVGGQMIYFGGGIGEALRAMAIQRGAFPGIEFQLAALATPADLLWFEQERRQDAAQS